MQEQIEQVEAYLAANRDRFVEDLKRLLRIPSISADSAYVGDMRRAAEEVAAQLREAGIEPEMIETAGFPIVYGESLAAPDAPTVLIYGHYDVQPPDPLEQWTTPPFEPQIRDDRIYARGATDDKGQMLTHIKSVEAWTKAVGKLPVNVKFLIEGEEEVGTDNLERFIETNRERLQADVAVVSDTSQYAPGIPAITYGLRGGLGGEVTFHGPSRDLHSGVFGGSLVNPANALACAVGQLVGADGRVQIPGFYDDVRPLTDTERERFAALPFDEEAYRDSIGVPGLAGEPGFTTLERRWARPTCDLNGLVSGYTGEGPKTIIPAWARAKVSIRLVPDQDPARIRADLEQFLRERCPEGLRFEFTGYHWCSGIVFDTENDSMQAASRSIEAAFGTPPVFMREGGSIPVVATFRDTLGIDTLLLGWGQNTDNLHAPDEHFSVSDFHRGIHASARLWYELTNRSN